MATGLLIGVVFMEIVALLGGMYDENGPAIFLACFVLGILVQELGHLLAGWAVGFRFASLQIGPLLLERQYGTMRAQLWLDMVAGGYAGMHADRARRLRRRLLIYIAGGPAANFLTVLVIVLASYLISLPPASRLGTAAGQFAAISLVLGMFSSVPLRSNDAGLIDMLLCSPLSSRRFMSTMALGSQFNQGLRPREWKKTWIKAAIYLPDNSPSEFYGRFMAYLAANDGKDADLAALHLERCLELTPALTAKLRDLVAQEAVVFSAWFKMDPLLADKWLNQVSKRKALAPTLRIRMEAALHCSHGDFDAAVAAWQRGWDRIKQMPFEPSTNSLRESWMEWRTEILERKAQLTTA